MAQAARTAQTHGAHDPASKRFLGKSGWWGAVGIGLFMGLVLGVIWHLETPIALLGNGVSQALTSCFLVGAIVSSVVLTLRARKDAGQTQRADIRPAAFATLAILAAGLACALAMCFVSSGVAAILLAGCAGALVGSGMSLLVPAWSEWAMQGSPVRLVHLAAVSAPIAMVFFAAYRLLPSALLDVILMVLAVVASIACLGIAGTCDADSGWIWVPEPRAPLRLFTAMSDRGDQLESKSATILSAPTSSTSGSSSAMGTPNTAGAAGTSGAVSAGAIFKVLWMPVTCVVFCAFIIGLTWNADAAMEWRWRDVSPDLWGAFLGAIAFSALGILVSRRQTNEGCLATLSRVVLPISLLVVLLVPVFKLFVVTPAGVAACSFGQMTTFAAIFTVAACDLLVAGRLSGSGVGVIMPALVGMLSAADLLGMASITLLGESGRVLCLLIEAALLAVIIVSYAMRARGVPGAVLGVDDGQTELSFESENAAMSWETQARDAAGVSAQETPGGSRAVAQHSAAVGAGIGNGANSEQRLADEAFAQRCTEIASSHDLSRREEEVLRLVARGHSSRFIATELCISENTVRTHVRHIYEKIGVTSREELFALVDGRTASE